MKLSLTHEGLSRLGFYQDFVLRTDNANSPIKCSKSQISFISPVVSKLLLNDPTINEFSLKAANSSKCTEIIQSLLNGNSIIVPYDLICTFSTIVLELGNEELFSAIEEDLTLENALEIICTKHMKSFSVEREIEFIASHFSDLKNEEISYLDISIIDSILGSKSLIIESEHSLFEFISNLVRERGNENRFLLSHLHLEFLDVEDITSFIELISEEDIGIFLPCIYRRLRCPLLKGIGINETRFNSISIPYKENKFDGIFSHLWKENDENPIEKRIVRIEETDEGSNSNNIPFLIDPVKRMETDWHYSTINQPDSALIIDFIDWRVSINGYSLKSHSTKYNDQYFVNSWKVEGSNDKNQWSLIDEQHSNVLQKNFAEGFWRCEESKPFRYFRIMMTEKNSCKTDHFLLHAIELFGKIYKK